MRNGTRSPGPASRSGSSSVTPNGAIVHHGTFSAAAAARTRAIGWKAEEPRSIGARPPAAA